jgi:pimeloyl-ACP methyl ester carboxylesterase
MNVYYQESGSKDNHPIVFVHGGGLGSSCYKLQFDHFNDYHCIAPDLPGHGERHEEQLISIEQCSQDVADVIKAITPKKKAHVVGVSFGAQVVVDLIARFPDAVDRVVINSCVLRNSVILQKLSSFLIPLVQKSGKEKAFKRYKKLKFPEDIFETMYRDTRRITKENYKNLFKAYFQYHIPQSIRDFKAPALIVLGTKELGIVKKSMRDLAGILPNNSAFMAKGETHSFAFQNPELFNRTVRAWFEGTALPENLIPL